MGGRRQAKELLIGGERKASLWLVMVALQARRDLSRENQHCVLSHCVLFKVVFVPECMRVSRGLRAWRHAAMTRHPLEPRRGGE